MQGQTSGRRGELSEERLQTNSHTEINAVSHGNAQLALSLRYNSGTVSRNKTEIQSKYQKWGTLLISDTEHQK